MIITQVDIHTLNVPLTKPLKVAIGSIDSALNIAIKITTSTGLIGWGEASPCAYIVGDTQQTNYQTAQQLARLILGKDPIAIEDRMSDINNYIVSESSARAAFDMALYDIAAKLANLPLYQFSRRGPAPTADRSHHRHARHRRTNRGHRPGYSQPKFQCHQNESRAPGP